MSDYNSGLPVRTQADGADERLHVKIVDGTNPAVNQVTVDSDKNLHVLNAGHDPGGIQHPVRVSELGALTPDGQYDATNNTKPGTLGRIMSSRSATPGDATMTMRQTGVQGSAPNTVWAADISLHDHSGNPFTNTNPLPVSLEESAGTEIHSYTDNAAVPVGSAANADYAVTALKTIKVKKITCSASGKGRFEIQTSPDGTTFTTKAVLFNSTAQPSVFWDIFSVQLTDTGTGAKVRVICKNLDNQPQDMYVTISGTEQ